MARAASCGLIADLQTELNRQIRPRYVARVEERVYVSYENDPGRLVIIPDIRLFPDASESWRGELPARSMQASDTVEPMDVTTLIDEEIHEPRIEIIDSLDRSVITVIEVLSNRLAFTLTNKWSKMNGCT